MLKPDRSIHPEGCACRRCRSPRHVGSMRAAKGAQWRLHPIALAGLACLLFWAAVAACIWGAAQ